jgi:phosphate transport system permease protein
MESFFKRLSAFSATLILLILTSIFIVLFIYAKPAIKEYGLHFLIDPRWDVVVTVKNNSTSNKNPQKNVSNQKAAANNNTIPTDNDLAGIIPPSSAKASNSNQNSNSNANIPTDNDLAGIIPNSGSSNSNSQAIATDNDLAGILGQSSSSSQTKVIYGGLIPIVGTILSTLIAMIFGVPVAMGIAVFLAEIAPPFIAKPVGIAIELLAAIPSIIYGMWGLFYFGPFISHIFGGASVSLLVAGLVLGIMIIPFMASLTRDSMKTTPSVLKESAYAMGATKFEVIKDVIFPYAKSGIIGSMILALGRALGETMAVAFVIGGVFSFPHKLTDPTVSIPVVLANNFAESNGISLNALFYLALILFVISFIVITFAKFYFLRDNK